MKDDGTFGLPPFLGFLLTLFHAATVPLAVADGSTMMLGHDGWPEKEVHTRLYSLRKSNVTNANV